MISDDTSSHGIRLPIPQYHRRRCCEEGNVVVDGESNWCHRDVWKCRNFDKLGRCFIRLGPPQLEDMSLEPEETGRIRGEELERVE